MTVLQRACLSLLSAACFSCNTPTRQMDGDRQLVFLTENGPIATRMRIVGDSVLFLNSAETIVAETLTDSAGCLTVVLPHYGSRLSLCRTQGDTLTGSWTTPYKTGISIPVKAFRKTPVPPTDMKQRVHYMCLFEDSPQDTVIGHLSFVDGKTEGTFLTASGDYRWLEGEETRDGFSLSCFDGAHLFSFTGTRAGDSLTNGLFRSGNSYITRWSGVKTGIRSLTHPDSLTKVVGTDSVPLFSAIDVSGNIVQCNKAFFSSHVTALALVGSWCPNCTDLERFLLEETGFEPGRDFQIIALCFEPNDRTQALKQLAKRFWQRPILPLLGGSASKTDASKLFPQLSPITAFPTLILLDREGKIRHVHTGFYGPGTGSYHTLYTEAIRHKLAALIAENQ